MEKKKEKEWLALQVVDYHKIGLNDRLGFTTKKRLRNSSSILGGCIMAEEKHKESQKDKNIQIDFTLICGKVSFFVEKEAALDILEYQEQLLIKAYDARIECAMYDNYSREYALADKKADRLWYGIPDKVIDYIKKKHSDSISSYVYVDFYDIVDYSGSYYDECYEEDSIPDKSFAKGVIKADCFLNGLKNCGYLEGINYDDPSISDPLEFMKHSLKDGSNSYYGFGIPHSKKALKKPKKASK